MKKSENKILHIPTCLGAVAVIYNLPGKPQLRFTPRILAGIFMGEITNWRDQRIVAVNPDVRLPDLEIKVVHRSESSGTTYLFTDYLTKVSDSWRQKAKRGKLIEWPAGIGVEGNGGIAQFVQKISGAVGYVELSYAIKNKFPMAMIKNRSGKFIKASLESVSKAAEVELPLDCRILITDTSIADGYPISAFTYLIFYREQAYQRRSEARAKELVELLRWCILKGQIYNRGLHYAPLPATAVEKAEKIISSITYQGEKLSK
jgi:phosphate transport system substrate-binding protein